jgi:hypothetical protein
MAPAYATGIVARASGAARAVINRVIMTTLALEMLAGHPFITLDGRRWLFDTGSPVSFGSIAHLTIGEHTAAIAPNYVGCTAETIARHTGIACAGLLGGDVINRFDWILDARAGRISATSDAPEHVGERHQLYDVLGVPLIDAHVRGQPRCMIFDTGAQYAYAEKDMLDGLPIIGRQTDFLPGMGTFDVDLRQVPVQIGSMAFTLECGSLPGMFAMALMLTGAAGIVGSAALLHATIAYAPRRGALFLAP